MDEIQNPALKKKEGDASVELFVDLPKAKNVTPVGKKKLREVIKSLFDKFKKLPAGKKTFVLAVLIIIFLTVSAGFAFAFIQISANKRSFENDGLLIGQDGDGNEESLEEPKPDDIKDQESPLNGVLYTKDEMSELVKRYPLAIVVENHTDARPQSGLNNADIVYEFLAEGGITRTLPIYWGKQSKEVGPVRSARKYMIDMLSEYDALFMHIGWAEGTGNTDTDAAAYISSTDTKSFLWSGYSWRSSDRVAPHNAYTETSKLWEQAEGKGWSVEDYSTSSWKFKNDATLDERPLTSIIDIKFGSSNSYGVKWTYDRDSNLYRRDCGGEISKDKVTGVQLESKTIIVQEVVKSYPKPADPKSRIVLDLIGEGNVTVFRDGESVSGTWKKSSTNSKTRFYNSDGVEIELNRGNIWIEMIPVVNNKLEGSFTYN